MDYTRSIDVIEGDLCKAKTLLEDSKMKHLDFGDRLDIYNDSADLYENAKRDLAALESDFLRKRHPDIPINEYSSMREVLQAKIETLHSCLLEEFKKVRSIDQEEAA